MQDKKDKIVSKLKDFIGDKTAVIGISGGIDSAVIAALCSEAVGHENVAGLSLPYGTQDCTDADTLAKQLGINYSTFNIKPAVDSIYTFRHSDFEKKVRGNVMARIRMVVLYSFSNEFNGIVVGTTNRSEAEIGYYTKYGDGAVDVEPIASLWKREVYEIGKLLNIPEAIMTKAPSACLWEGQTDEGEFGFTYDDIETYFTSLQYHSDPKPFLSLETAEKISNMIKANEHKKHLPPAFKI